MPCSWGKEGEHQQIKASIWYTRPSGPGNSSSSSDLWRTFVCFWLNQHPGWIFTCLTSTGCSRKHHSVQKQSDCGGLVKSLSSTRCTFLSTATYWHCMMQAIWKKKKKKKKGFRAQRCVGCFWNAYEIQRNQNTACHYFSACVSHCDIISSGEVSAWYQHISVLVFLLSWDPTLTGKYQGHSFA